VPNRFFIAAIVLLSFSFASAQGIPLTAGLIFPDVPCAGVTGTEAVVLNPAALFINKPLGLHIYHTSPKDKLAGDDAVLISAAGLGFGYQRLRRGMSEIVSRYDFAFSSRLVKNVYAGLSYTYYKTALKPLDKSHSWNVSVLTHLNRFASVSGEVQNLNRQKYFGSKTDLGYRLSAALHPAGERVTIGGNLQMYGKQDIKDASWRASARVVATRGLVLYGGFDDKHTFGVGIELHLGEGLLGAEGYFDDETNHFATTTYTGYTVARRDDIISGAGKILQVDLSGDIPEERTSQLFMFRSGGTVYQKLAAIKAAQRDRQVKGILLTIKNPAIGWGKLADFRRAITEFRKTGKTVVCYLGVSPGNGSYYLASAADQVYMLPIDALNLTGLRAEVTFYKGTLDKIGVEPQIEKQGEYKNYPNQFTETTLIPPHREALESLLDDLYSQLVGEIAPDRGLTTAQLQKIIDSGPFNSVQAESLGLVDGRYYPADLEGRLPELFGGNFPLVSSDYYQSTPQYRERFGEPPQIALISISGSITRGNSGSTFIDGRTAGSATISRAIRQARDDRSVKAIVMRLDTPGGDALASDLIWGELMAARQRKPVIVSMSDVCASGGYYVASASDKIFLEPTTVTGSIGVFYGKANLEQFYRKLGMNTETITRGKHANMYSMKSGFSAEERLIVRRQVRDLYDNFLTIVAANRNISKDSVDTIARGRVWSGKSALAIGLADATGGVLEAITEAKIKGGIADSYYQIVELPERRIGLFNLPEMLLSRTARFLGLTNVAQNAALKTLAAEAGLDSPQMRLPYELTIE
jgi:protease IV